MIRRPPPSRAASRLLFLLLFGCLVCFSACFLTCQPTHGTAMVGPAAFDLADLDEQIPLLGWMDYLPDHEADLTWQTALTRTVPDR